MIEAEDRTMRALDFLIWLRDDLKCCPVSTEGRRMRPSNAELRRWCKDRAVLFNGEAITDPDEEVLFPITSLVFFPKGKRRTTIV